MTTAGTIGVINSIIAGATSGLLARLLGWPLPARAGKRVVIFVLGVIAHYHVEQATLLRSAEHLEVGFPSPGES